MTLYKRVYIWSFVRCECRKTLKLLGADRGDEAHCRHCGRRGVIKKGK